MKASSARRSRIVAVTGGLAVTGGVIGAILAPLLLGVVGSILGGRAHLPLTAASYGLSALVGASLGAVLLPTTAWWLMRSVPLGRAVLGTILGTLVGGGIGMFASALHPTISIGSALAGYLGSALLVRRGAHGRGQVGADPASSLLSSESRESREDE